MTERLFFALWPNAAVRHELAGLVRGEGGGRGRAMHPSDLHLTLAFLGPLSEAQRRCAEQAAEGVRQAPFALRLERIGHWRRARILWCAPNDTPDGLARLVGAVTSGLPGCGLALEARPYRPHVTLVRGLARGPSADRPIAPIDWPVCDFVLAGGSGGGPPRYRIHRRWPLGDDPR